MRNLLVVARQHRKHTYMTPSNIPEENGEKAAGTTLSHIVIEQMKFLVGEILDRIAASEGDQERKIGERQLH